MLQAESVEERSMALNEAFTYALFINVCRSLFEAHKLMFSFLLAIKILQNRKQIDPGECEAFHNNFAHVKSKLSAQFLALMTRVATSSRQCIFSSSSSCHVTGTCAVM